MAPTLSSEKLSDKAKAQARSGSKGLAVHRTRFATETLDEPGTDAQSTLGRAESTPSTGYARYLDSFDSDRHNGMARLELGMRSLRDEIGNIAPDGAKALRFRSRESGLHPVDLLDENGDRVDVDIDDYYEALSSIVRNHEDILDNPWTLRKNPNFDETEEGTFVFPLAHQNRASTFVLEIHELRLARAAQGRQITSAALGHLHAIAGDNISDKAAGALVINDQIDAIVDEKGNILWSFTAACAATPDGFEDNKYLWHDLNGAAEDIEPDHLERVTVDKNQNATIWF